MPLGRSYRFVSLRPHLKFPASALIAAPPWLIAVDFSQSLGSVELMGELPRPVLLVHRLLFAVLLLYMASTLWQLVLRPVTMLSDSPATVFALVLAVGGLILAWVNGFKANCLLLLCDALLLALAVLHFQN